MNPSDADPHVPVPPTDGDASASDAPTKRRRGPRQDRVAATMDAAATDGGGPGEGGGDSGGGGGGDAGGEGGGHGGGDGGGEGEARKGRRGRNRRRGRRRGDRADRGSEAAADGAEGGGGEGGAASTLRPDLQAPVLAQERFADVISGAFDAQDGAEAEEEAVSAGEMSDGDGGVADGSEPSDAPDDAATGTADPAEVTAAGAAASDTDAGPSRRVLAPEPDAPKLHKVLAQSGVGSRRDLEQMIADGRVTVNGEAAHTGQRISFGDRIQIDGKPVRVRIAPPKARVLAYHKPTGEVVSHDDPQQRPTVFRRLPRLQQGKWQSVGRLDINTEGLLLFTNSGELANQLMHPRFGVEREYAVRSLGVLDETQRQQLLEGVEIDGQRAAFKRVEDGGGEGVNHWYRVVIAEGRNREVRKLFEAVGHAVSRLIRIRYGSVVLPRGLRRGVWVDLDDADIKALRRQAGGAEPGPRRDAGDGDAERRGKRGRRNKGADRDGRQGGVQGGARGPAIPDPLRQTFDKSRQEPKRQTPRVAELDEDEDDFRGPIPDPLRQTFDRTRVQSRRQAPRVADIGDDDDDLRGPIPDPLQQTFDKRHVQKNGLLGGRGKRGGNPGAPREPDPMQTSVGYIGADAFLRKAGGGGGGGRGGGGRRGGGKRR